MEFAPFTISIWGFGISVGFLLPEFLSCKKILDNIKDELKSKKEKIDDDISDDSL